MEPTACLEGVGSDKRRRAYSVIIGGKERGADAGRFMDWGEQ